ncbi:MAG: Bax inhibitor-1/YccA family protein [Deltaproteobacteria bacterium]|nr:Bax inhibitor-1/YccA family protein [Deltaproteobacteria bacterium]
MYPTTFTQRGIPLARASAQTRLAFLRKVYGLFFAGILTAAGGAMTALYTGEPVLLGKGIAVPPLVAFVAQHFIISLLVFFGGFFLLSAVRHRPGVNVAALLGFTFLSGLFIAPSLFVATLMAKMGGTLSANPVRDAFLLAGAGFGGLTAYAFVSKKDFSFLGGMLWMGLLVLIGASIIGMFVGSAVFHLAIASVGVLLFGAYVLYDTSRLLHSEEPITPVDAAISLYLDFLNLFLFLLHILSGRRD